MNWKEFFKPTISKIISSIIYIILQIITIIVFSGPSQSSGCDNIVCYIVMGLVVLFIFPFSLINKLFNISSLFGLFSFTILIDIIFMYLLVSTLIFVVKFIKEKRNK
ncbi:MAG: hypothetical protein AB7V77_00950 [Candidatus Woesearchaeota archaeon]